MIVLKSINKSNFTCFFLFFEKVATFKKLKITHMACLTFHLGVLLERIRKSYLIMGWRDVTALMEPSRWFRVSETHSKQFSKVI